MTVSQDDLERARHVSLLAAVQLSGLHVVRKGACYTTKEHDSLCIWLTPGDQHWYQFSQGVGGDVIDWVRHTQKVDFETAVNWLTNRPLAVVTQAPVGLHEQKPLPPLPQALARRLHDDMAVWDRDWWLERGVPIDAQDQYLLGVHVHSLYRTCYTIPIFEDGKLVNIRMRLAHPKNPQDKYRPYDSGRGTQLYGREILTGSLRGVVVVAGEIKRIVLQANGIPTVSPTGGCQNWRPEWTAWLKDVTKVYVCFDPGEEGAAARLAAEIGARARLVVGLDQKPDDLVNTHGAQALRYHLKHAVPLKEYRRQATVQLPEPLQEALYDDRPPAISADSERVPWKGQLLP